MNNFTLRDSSFTGTFGDVEAVSNPEGTIRFGTPGRTTGLTGTGLFEGNTSAAASTTRSASTFTAPTRST